MKSQIKSSGWIAASALFIGMVLAASLWSFQRIETAADVAMESQVNLRRADELLSALKDAETGARGFLLSGDETFLEPYALARREIPGLLAALRQASYLGDSQRHLNTLTPVVGAKLIELARVIALQRAHDLSGAVAAVKQGEGKRLMDSIRVEMGGFVQQEQSLQRQRQQEFQSTMRYLLAVIVAASALALLSALVFAYLIYRRSRERLQASVILETQHLLEIQQRTYEELKQAHGTLQLNEEKLAVTLNSIGDGVIATDVHGCVTLLNPLAERLTGWTLGQALGRPVEEIFHIVNQDTRLPVVMPVTAALANGTVQGLANHTVLIARDGSECDIADSCAPIRDRDARVMGAVLVFRDVTDEHATQRSLRDQQFYNRSLLEANMDALVATDTFGTITDVNAQMLALTGRAKDALIGTSFQDLFTDPQRAQSGIRRVLSEKRVLDYELTAVSDTGCETAVSFNASVFCDRDGALQGVLAAARDITEGQRLNQLLLDKNIELEDARAAADKANRAKSEFLATMSHEIRTPMNGVIGMIDVLEQSSLNGPQLEMTNVIHDSAFALLAVINDILDFSKIEANKLETESVPLSIAQAVESACENMHVMALKHLVELTLFVDPDIPAHVLGDPGRLRQVLVNLTNNAIKFSGQQDRAGRVSVRAVLVEQQQRHVIVEFQVIDNGIGIDEPTRARLFTAFIQADSSITRHFGGTGLGLAICSQLVELMAGTVAVQSELGEGSQFSVCMPFLRVDQAVKAEPAGGRLAGLPCLVMVGLEGIANDMATYMAHDGAIVQRATDWAAAKLWINDHSLGLGVVVVDTVDGQLPLASMRRLTDAQPGQDKHFVAIGRGKRRRSRVDADGVIWVDANVLTRSALIEAVEIAAGRAVAPPRDVLPADLKAPAVPVSRDEARRAGSLILVAEDNEYNQKVVLQQLLLLGRTADIACNGRDALKRWQSGGYAILLADLHMPEMDGYELTTAIREAEGGRSRMPIIAFTANALKGEAEHCLAMGMDDYLSKPVQLIQLKAMLKKWQTDLVSEPMPLGALCASALDTSEVPHDD